MRTPIDGSYRRSQSRIRAVSVDAVDEVFERAQLGFLEPACRPGDRRCKPKGDHPSTPPYPLPSAR